MAFHYTEDKVRYDNDQTKTDDALTWMPKFPKLQRLYLKEGQAADEGMRFVADLSELEVFFVWDAYKLTDAGVQHLTELKKLKSIHISNSPISDGALKVFGGLGNLERLSLQGNHFTDAGVPHLSELKSLKSLWIGVGKAKLTDKIAPHLAKLTNLEALDLQNTPFTDVGVKELKTLTKLRQLYLHGTNDEEQTITDASAQSLMNLRSLQGLEISNCRMSDNAIGQLARLPKLKLLSVDGKNIPFHTKKEQQ
jgi:Leucine-rich repeat (LRR) protein